MSELRERLYLSTTAEDAPRLAREHGLGLEIAEYCTAANMDRNFPSTDAAVRAAMAGVERFILHAPFNELCPAAIDPLVREIAVKRYRQASALAGSYGIRKMVVHSGFIPNVYFPAWFAAEAVPFWKGFLHEMPEDMVLCLENVMEPGPDLPLKIVEAVNDPRLRLCLDVGHASCKVSDTPIEEWFRAMGDRIAHIHLHNNDGTDDLHWPLGRGVLDMERVLSLAETYCPAATMTIENILAAESVQWLRERQYL